MAQNYNEILAFVEDAVRAEGLTFLGVLPLGPDPVGASRLKTWLDSGKHAGMRYLENHRALREDPSALLPGAKTLVAVGLPYFQGDRLPREHELPRVAQYARLKDYHQVLWRRGEAALTRLHERLDTRAVGRVITDSAPLLERSWAARSGAGFIGKNTCFIRPQEGSFLLLGELLTTLALPSTEREQVDPHRRGASGGCGSCKRCQVHCPTGALDEDYSLDARKCLSYWTIEHRGTIPERFWPWLKFYVFGCDICQLVCPYNRGAEAAALQELKRVEPSPPLFEVATLTQESYERRFGGTPMTRAKRTGLMRNALIAMTVTRDPRLEEAVTLGGERGDDMVRETIAQIRRWQAGVVQNSLSISENFVDSRQSGMS